MTSANIADLLDRELVSSGLSQSRSALSPTLPPSGGFSRPLQLSVAWGDLSRVPADIHVVGHYQGVLPVSAEKALDVAISGNRGLIAEHTRRGWVAGVLGEIAYFPGPDTDNAADAVVRRAAIAGIGRPGTFSEQRATQLYASLLRELLSLVGVRQAALVLIGSGAGNLTVAQAARALVTGFATALQSTSTPESALAEVVVVEIDRLRAERLRSALSDAAIQHRDLVIAERVVTHPGGDIGVDSAAAIAIRTLGALVRDQGGADSVTALLERVPAEFREVVRRRLAEVPDDPGAVSVSVGAAADGRAETPPTCICVTQGEGGTMRWAALTGRATIPEREVSISQRLVDQVVERLTAPVARDAAVLPRMLTRFVVPVDFRPHITADAALLLEVDATTARVCWEFLTDQAHEDGEQMTPLAARTPIARQMRTTYSRVATDEHGDPRRALVIADPGDPALGQSLPSARQEGAAVAAVLRDCGLEVKLYVGAPGTTPLPDSEPATQLDVLTELLVGGYDIVHFAGHGAFEPDRPELAGWVFANGLLSARELSQLTSAPRLVVANACWSAARPESRSARPLATSDVTAQSALTPVLADEFLRVGVAHYIGASWSLPDDLALQFATTFYRHLLGLGTAGPGAVGRSLCAAREKLFYLRGHDAASSQPERWSAWAAYQHYGDPCDVLAAAAPSRPPTGQGRDPA